MTPPALTDHEAFILQRRAAGQSLAAIAAAAGCSVPTVINRIRRLRELGYVVGAGATRGRKAITAAPTAQAAPTATVDAQETAVAERAQLPNPRGDWPPAWTTAAEIVRAAAEGREPPPLPRAAPEPLRSLWRLLRRPTPAVARASTLAFGMHELRRRGGEGSAAYAELQNDPAWAALDGDGEQDFARVDELLASLSLSGN